MLLLDEPTNHLDLEACDALKRGLATYEGTLLVVSHNRDFLDSLVDCILEIQPGEAVLYQGNYSEWLERIEARERDGPPKGVQPKRAAGKGRKTAQRKRREAEQRQQRSNRLRKIRREVSSAEARLRRCTDELADLDPQVVPARKPAGPGISRVAEAARRADRRSSRTRAALAGGVRRSSSGSRAVGEVGCPLSGGRELPIGHGGPRIPPAGRVPGQRVQGRHDSCRLPIPESTAILAKKEGSCPRISPPETCFSR